MSKGEKLVVAAALAPHLLPSFYNLLVLEVMGADVDLPAFGCVPGVNHRGLLPTVETILFLFAGTDLAHRLRIRQALFNPNHLLARQQVVTVEEVRQGEPASNGRLLLHPDYLELLLTGQFGSPALSAGFPAQRIETSLEWKDLILPSITAAQVQDLTNWVKYQQELRDTWSLGTRLKPGYRALFYGPPGTGKTLTATLLGKVLKQPVYRVDLSLVSSKYIGETEKNLGSLFNRAEAKNWILFFDEADALFGKRTETRDAHDRFANQEIAFLLQRVEEYDGLVILASNLKGNLDPAFARRFQAMIPFPLPNATERLELWNKTMPDDGRRGDVRVEDLAARYELSGAAILNIVQFSALRALGRGTGAYALADIMEGIRLEYQKEGKLI